MKNLRKAGQLLACSLNCVCDQEIIVRASILYANVCAIRAVVLASAVPRVYSELSETTIRELNKQLTQSVRVVR